MKIIRSNSILHKFIKKNIFLPNSQMNLLKMFLDIGLVPGLIFTAWLLTLHHTCPSQRCSTWGLSKLGGNKTRKITDIKEYIIRRKTIYFQLIVKTCLNIFFIISVELKIKYFLTLTSKHFDDYSSWEAKYFFFRWNNLFLYNSRIRQKLK